MNAKRPERIPPIKAVMTPFPWFVVIDRKGVVRFNGFRLGTRRGAALLKSLF